MPRLFGTDGVRGKANVDLTAELALELSVAAAHVLGETGQFEGHRPVALVARDPRASGEFLEAAVVAGLASAGVDVVKVGVVPTPAAAFLVNHLNADLGVMLSASHNPMPDNGIKFLARGGVKLDDYLEDLVEARLDVDWERPTGACVGRVVDNIDAVDDYVDHLLASLGPNPLTGLKVVLDCANGAAHHTGPAAFGRTGAEVRTIHASPDGLNINDHCGSTHMGDLSREVVATGAHLGFAFDGDADRCLAVDAAGELIDGDQILAILALALKRSGQLHMNTVVATVMSNLGFFQAMSANDIRVDQTKVGDRYVLESMNNNGFALGGEQSGHVIMSEFATTGDGVLTALHVAAQVASTGRSLRELGDVMTRLPQAMINVAGVNKARAGIDPDVTSAVTAASRELGTAGRVLLRPSGTEPVVRVMVEADTSERANAIAERLAAIVKERLAR